MSTNMCSEYKLANILTKTELLLKTHKGALPKVLYRWLRDYPSILANLFDTFFISFAKCPEGDGH